MDWKDFIKTTEAVVVLGGLTATLLLGKMFALLTGVAYILLNVPKAWLWIKSKF